MARRVLGPGRLVSVVVASIVAFAGCAPSAAPQQPAPAAKPPAQAAPAAAAPAPPPAKPVAEPAKPAVQPPKPASAAAQPAKPAAAEKPASGACQQRLLVATANISSSYYAYHVAESKYLQSRVPEVCLTVTETGGGADNLARMSKGELHIGLLSTNDSYQAYHGVGEFKDKAQAHLRYLWIYSAGARVFMVTEQSGITTLSDLTGKPFNPGPRGSTTEKDTKGQFEILGIKPQWYTGSIQDSLDAIKSKRIVGLVKSQPGRSVDASTLELMVSTKVRALGFSDQEVKKILDKRPWDSFVTVKKDEWIKGFPEFTTFAPVVGTGTTKDALSEDLAYKLTKAALDPQAVEEISPAFTAVKGANYREQTLEMASIPLHKGSLRYFREIGAKVPDHLVPPEAK